MRTTDHISAIMLKDHLRLLSLLHAFDRIEQDDFAAKRTAFETLKWHAEKHMFTEEKVVFTSFNAEEKKEDYNLFLEVSKEHTTILNEMARIHNDLQKKISADGFHLRELLINHQKYEEKVLYPLLEKELTTEEKELILGHIAEII